MTTQTTEKMSEELTVMAVDEWKEGQCVLMGCELTEDWETLQEIIDSKEDISEDVRNQARLLIKLGSEPTDKYCSSCFWKWVKKIKSVIYGESPIESYYKKQKWKTENKN